ncbi:MAG: hypothetical protein HZC40_14345 [Chloroflexi bacterium]|nr:hypothetical protein [Chloroflexota bacterium]
MLQRFFLAGILLLTLPACAPAMPAPIATPALTTAPTTVAVSPLAPTVTPTLTSTPLPTLTPTIAPTPAPDTSAALVLARAQIKNFNEKDFTVRATWLADKRALVVIQSKTTPDTWVLLPGAKELTQVPTTAGIDGNAKLVRFDVENGKVVGYAGDRRFVWTTWDKHNGEKPQLGWYAIEQNKLEGWDSAHPAESLARVMKERWNSGPILKQGSKENFQPIGYKEISAKDLFLYVLEKYKGVRFSFPNVVSPTGEVIFSEKDDPWLALASLVSRVEPMGVIPTPNTAVWVDKDPDGALVMKINTKIFEGGDDWGNGWNNGEASGSLRLDVIGVLVDGAAQAKLIAQGENSSRFSSVAADAEARVIVQFYKDFSDGKINKVDGIDSSTMGFLQNRAKGALVEFEKRGLTRGRVAFSIKETPFR